MTEAYGAGNLAGSIGVMVRPLRGRADTATVSLALVVAAVLTAVFIVPGLALTVMAYAVVGIANSYFFGATLAARSEYAPIEAKGQVFVWVGALKITAGSAGTAAAGAIIGIGVHLPLLLGAIVIAAAVGIATIDRMLQP